MRRNRARQKAEDEEISASLREQKARMVKLEQRVQQINAVVERRERRKDQAAKRRAKAKERL